MRHALAAWYGPAFATYSMWGVPRGEVGPGTRVIHGHFPAGLFAARRTVTWVRDPAWQVASQYFYFRSEPDLALHSWWYRFVSAGELSLLEFAGTRPMRDIQHRYMNGRTVDDLDFVGVAEHRDQELHRLAATLVLPPQRPDFPHVNAAASAEYDAFRSDPDRDGLLDEIRARSPRDTELYATALDRMHSWNADRAIS